jgi:enoyl-CoA hydratase
MAINDTDTVQKPKQDGEFTQIRYEVLGEVARIVLDRPRYRNVQSRVMREELDQAFVAATRDKDVRVIILKGEGASFSAGHDVGTPEELADREQRPPAEGSRATQSWDLYVANHLRWRNVPKPTIAQVHGYCILAGWSLAASMDIITAAEDALFLPCIAQYFSEPWDIGFRQAKEILFESRFVTAAEAKELGFVNLVVPPEELDEATLAMAQRIAQNNPLYVRLVKQAMNEAQDAMGFQESLKATHPTFMKAEFTGTLNPVAGSRRLPFVELAMRHREGS